LAGIIIIIKDWR